MTTKGHAVRRKREHQRLRLVPTPFSAGHPILRGGYALNHRALLHTRFIVDACVASAVSAGC